MDLRGRGTGRRPHARPLPGGRLLARLAHIEPEETGAALIAFAYFFCLFASYFALRPVRETMGITGGVRNLQWLFTATFVAMLVTVPIFGLLNSRFRRTLVVPWVYGFFILNMLAFAVVLHERPDDVWVARVFYVWLSVFNLFVVSVAWSVMVDVFSPDQGYRLFAFISAGASAGGLIGPVIGGLAVRPLGFGGLIALSAVILAATLLCVRYLIGWRSRHGAGSVPGSLAARENPREAIGGNPFAGVSLVAGSTYLLGISAFVLLLATVTTFLYFDQARMVEQAFPDRAAQTQVFSILDFVVQAIAISVQLFFTGRLALRLGVLGLLVLVPILMVGGFLVLSIAPVFSVLAVVMVIRRSGEYALTRPAREMLFTSVDVETKYKAKNFIDTVIYRGGDAVSGWVKAGLDALGQGFSFVALVGACLAALWAWIGLRLGRQHQARVEIEPQPVAVRAVS